MCSTEVDRGSFQTHSVVSKQSSQSYVFEGNSAQNYESNAQVMIVLECRMM